MNSAFDPEAGLIIVPTRLSGPKGDTVVRLALDTGATTTTLKWEVVVFLGYDPAAAKKRVEITTASGVEFVPQFPIQSVEAIGQERRSFPILCHTFPPSSTVDGVLGLDFFRGKRLIIDFRTALVTVE